MSSPTLSPREEELTMILREATDPVVVYLSEDYHPASPLMHARLQSALQSRPRWKLIELPLHACRTWANQQGIHGTPSILVYQNGHLQTTLLGVLEEEDIASGLK